MRVPNLVPIGPQAATCIPSEGYTHTDTHTLSYIDILAGLPGFARDCCSIILSICAFHFYIIYFHFFYADHGIPQTFDQNCDHLKPQMQGIKGLEKLF